VKDLAIEGWNCALEEVGYDTVYLMFSLNARNKLRSPLMLWRVVMCHVETSSTTHKI